MYDPHTRESRGFGFVTMETAEEAENAIATLNGTELMGRTLSIEKVVNLTQLLCILFSLTADDAQARRGRARTPTPGRYYGPPKRRERKFCSSSNPVPYALLIVCLTSYGASL